MIENPVDTHRIYAMTPMDQQSTALLYGFWARTSGAAEKQKEMQIASSGKF